MRISIKTGVRLYQNQYARVKLKINYRYELIMAGIYYNSNTSTLAAPMRFWSLFFFFFFFPPSPPPPYPPPGREGWFEGSCLKQGTRTYFPKSGRIILEVQTKSSISRASSLGI